MKVFFIRHGESLANIGKVSSAISNDGNNKLTRQGKKQIRNSAKNISSEIQAVYVSPMCRTIESAKEFIREYHDKLELKVDDRLREIDYGIYTDHRDHPKMTQIAERQIAGDYEIRFGGGENKREILTRFFTFLLDCYQKHATHNVVVFSHGRAISMVESEFCFINHIKKRHIHTGNGTIKELYFDEKVVECLWRRIKELQNPPSKFNC